MVNIQPAQCKEHKPFSLNVQSHSLIHSPILPQAFHCLRDEMWNTQGICLSTKVRLVACVNYSIISVSHFFSGLHNFVNIPRYSLCTEGDPARVYIFYKAIFVSLTD